MTEHQLRFVPNIRLINGIAKTSLGGLGITPDDVSERVTRDSVGGMRCPVALKVGPQRHLYTSDIAYQVACVDFGTWMAALWGRKPWTHGLNYAHGWNE